MIRIIVLLAMIPSFAQAQTSRPMPASTPPPANFLPKDSPHLYRLYFYFHTTIDTIVQQQKAGRTPVEVQRIDRETAANFGLQSAQGLPTLRTVSNAYAAELRTVDDEEKVHANARAKLEVPPDRARMQAFEARRQAIVNRGIAALRTQLSVADWTAFQNFINGSYRTSHSIISVNR
jgi:hypothetical protein